MVVINYVLSCINQQAAVLAVWSGRESWAPKELRYKLLSLNKKGRGRYNWAKLVRMRVRKSLERKNEEKDRWILERGGEKRRKRQAKEGQERPQPKTSL